MSMGRPRGGSGCGGGGGRSSSCDESPASICDGGGDLAFLNSFEPRPRERDRLRFLLRERGRSDGVAGPSSASPSASTMPAYCMVSVTGVWVGVGSGSGSGTGAGAGGSSYVACGASGSGEVPLISGVPEPLSVDAFSPSLCASVCIGGRRPSFMRGNEAARLSLATADARRARDSDVGDLVGSCDIMFPAPRQDLWEHPSVGGAPCYPKSKPCSVPASA